MNFKHVFSGFFAALMLLCVSQLSATPPNRLYYELKVYHYQTAAQEEQLDEYLKSAYVPAAKKVTGEPVGVFKTLKLDTADKRIYVLITFRNLNEIESIDEKIAADAGYLTNGKPFEDAAYNSAPYTRMETIILHAFPKWPAPTAPHLSAGKEDRVYELRSYESPTQQLHINKVKMFNDGGETVLFNRLNFNAVFYARVIAGSHMPNLMYMTTFNSREDRDKHWEAFSSDPEWKKLVAMPEYQHNVSKADILFLHPVEYSDF
jgi:hypothetical protein